MLKINAKNLETATVLSLQGRIVNGETEFLRNAMRGIAERRDVVLDLAGVSMIDAHGLGVMLQLREQASARGMHFSVMNVGKPLKMVLEITRLDTVFEICDGIEYLPSVWQTPVAA